MELRRGMFARSKAGHDKNRIYVIMEVQGEYVYVADGEHSLLRRMKKKNRKHLQPILKTRFEGTPDDRAVREAIEIISRQGKNGAAAPAGRA